MPDELLSPREAEVLTFMTRGQSNKQIAKAMGISQWTVKAYVQSIFAKLNVPNRAAAAALWSRRPEDRGE